ncbi:hypothetical protein KY340_05150 [Candidatus Woesearchaeota archaeon]|nr:hypothetical protein [Candidatus Woesearchaeota archaeon]
MDNRLITALLIIALFYFAYKALFRFKLDTKKYPDEIEDIINSEKYKVKGQFDH